jgi:fatty-acyl-CoA synthase
MTRLRLYARALHALWRVGLLRLGPYLALRICLAWRRCRGSLAFLAEVAALRAGSRLALIDDDGPLTFAELRCRYQALAGELIARHSAGPSCQIAIIGRNHRSLVVALLAAARTGADVLLLNPDSPPDVLAKQLAAATPASGAPSLLVLHAAEIDVAALAPGSPRVALDRDVGSGSAEMKLPPLREPGRLCVLTAGSTGLPKRIGRKPTLASLLPFVLGLLERLPIAMHRPTVLAVPCFHGHGLATLATALAFAAPVHLARRYEIAPLLARDSIASPPIVVSVPTLLSRWLAAGPAKDSVAAVLSGSAPLPPQLCRRLLEALGPVLYNLYGSSEAGVVSLATPVMLALAPGTVGHPLPGTEVRILDVSGREIAARQLGQIHVRGPLVLRPDTQGWLRTGDLGRRDEAGRLHICGRADGMFVSGGENVYPQAVEACLLEHPAVAEAAIAVVADAEFGSRMRAFIVVRADASLTPEALGSWLRQRLDRHQQPKSIDLVEALPRNLLGKIDRPALRRIAERSTSDPAP